jgi:glycosyltransferase involved in cell wall biosynthesis
MPRLRREGSSLTAVEAARHGRPVVTSDDPAAAEIAGILGGDVVPAGDVAALAARLDHWLSHPEEAAAAGAVAREKAVVFDPAAVAERYAEVYAGTR